MVKGNHADFDSYFVLPLIYFAIDFLGFGNCCDFAQVERNHVHIVALNSKAMSRHVRCQGMPVVMDHVMMLITSRSIHKISCISSSKYDAGLLLFNSRWFEFRIHNAIIFGSTVVRYFSA